MKILFYCTAFNSLSQRVALALRSKGHAVTVELALSPELMISAAKLASPDIVICPFLTKRVPREVYTQWLTLIVHPGPPGDAGPSAIDWCLFGDTGEEAASDDQLAAIDACHSDSQAPTRMRSHWGVTVLQAIEALDAGPIWAFDQFALDDETRRMTKSDLYRGPVTRCAVSGVLAAIDRIEAAAAAKSVPGSARYPTTLQAPPSAVVESVTGGLPFLGGKTHERPLLKASMRDFLLAGSSSKTPISADAIVQRVNSADSQPGVLTSLFGKPLFVYGAVVQRDPLPEALAALAREKPVGAVLATREGAVLVTAGADYPIWICHVRRPKAKTDPDLHPKLPAVMGLLSMPELARSLGLFDRVQEWSATTGFGADLLSPWRRRPGTYQQVFVELEECADGAKVGYVYSEFYNGAFSTLQCEILLEAIRYTLAQPGLRAIVMMGGTGYFSNGIALNVIEGSPDPSAEGWANINAIDDCVEALLAPSGVLTFSAMRGNAAAGGLAVATAADVVLSVETAVHNPHYRGLGLYGSEWHTYSWYQRCGAAVASRLAHQMLPISTAEAKTLGLVDHVIDNAGLGAQAVIDEIKAVVRRFVNAKIGDVERDGGGLLSSAAPWTKPLLPMPSLAGVAGDRPLAEQLVTNKAKYLAYLFAGGEHRYASLQQHFQVYRQHELGQMTYDFFHPHRGPRFSTRCSAFVRKVVPGSTAARFALHRRYGSADWDRATDATPVVLRDEEELDEFDSLGDVAASEAIPRLPAARPELVPGTVIAFASLPRRFVADKEAEKSSPLIRSPSAFSTVSNDTASTAPSSAPSIASPQPQLSGAKSLAQERDEVSLEQQAAQRAATDAANANKKASPAISFARDDAPVASTLTPPGAANVSVSHSTRQRSKTLYHRMVHFFSKKPSRAKAASGEDLANLPRPVSFKSGVPLTREERPTETKGNEGCLQTLRGFPLPARTSTHDGGKSDAPTSQRECLFQCYYSEDGTQQSSARVQA
ncbi:hypothetical protein ACQY0O_004579 [Thecaphora frezii]